MTAVLLVFAATAIALTSLPAPDSSFTGTIERKLVVYARDPGTGTISVAQHLVNGLRGVEGLVFPSAATAVPMADGASVYVTAFGTRLVHFDAVTSGPSSGVAFVEAAPAGVLAGPTAPSPGRVDRNVFERARCLVGAHDGCSHDGLLLYSPRYTGLRFSAKARGPSRASLLAKTGPPISSSFWSASVSW